MPEASAASAGGSQEDAQPSVHLTLANVKGLTTILQAIKPAAKQACSVVVASEGLSFSWEDDSKTLQSSVFLRCELFSRFECVSSASVSFGVNLAQLVDALAVFASAGADAPVDLRYPGSSGELLLEMRDASEAHAQCTYASIYCLEQPSCGDMSDFWQDPVSFFLCSGHLLKEALEDLEWPSGNVRLTLQRDPQQLLLQASGNGSLQVQVPPQVLSGFHCAGERCAHGYKHKNMRMALCHIPHSKDVVTKVSVDINGLLKVTHMMPLAAPGGGGGGPRVIQSSLGQSAPLVTQGGGVDPARAGVVQFLTAPLEEEEL